MDKNLIDDGFHAELVEKAYFDGLLEIPVLQRPRKLVIPSALIPYTKLRYSKDHTEAIHFYEHDSRFSDVLTCTKEHVAELARFPAVISPDCSLYRDMPLCLQIANTYMNRAVGCYLQSLGQYVIPNVRWGDERSYTTCVLPEKFAFLGVPMHSIVSVSTYGCIRGKENQHYFREGLTAMLETLEPEVVLVYGAMPENVFSGLLGKARFARYPDWISLKRKQVG